MTSKKEPKPETRKVGLNGWISFRGALYQCPGLEHTTVDVIAYPTPYTLFKGITVQYPSKTIPHKPNTTPMTLLLKPASTQEAM